MSLLHRFHQLTPINRPFDRNELNIVFVNEPGVRRDPSGTPGNGVLRPYVPVSFGGCSGNPYADGMVLSEIMWKLVNAARCESPTTCTNPVALDSRMPRLGRKAFAMTLLHGTHSNLFFFVNQWRSNLRALFRDEDQALSAGIADQIARVFGDHHPIFALR